jgi:outer membrane lipoprotein-sorting protein
MIAFRYAENSMAPEDLASKPKRRRLWRVIAGLSVLVIALALFASQQGDDSGGNGPLNAIAQAAEKTQGEDGGRATMRSTVTSPSQPEPLEISGQMSFDADERSRGVLKFLNPDTSQPAEMEMVSDGATVYMRSSMFGREWMSLDLASAAGLDRDTLLPSEGDAKGELELLEETGNVRKLGKEDVNGVPTTHYRGTVSASENADRLREEGADEDFASWIEEEDSAIRVEAWIDAEELVRRMRIVQETPGDDSEGPTTMDMRMDFFDFGIDPEIDVPDSDEVFDATSLAKEEIGRSGGN